MAAPTPLLLPEGYNRRLAVYIEPSLEALEGAVYPYLKGRMALVADLNTWGALGENLFNAIKKQADCVPVIFPFTPTASDKVIEMLAAEVEDCDGLIAVGSGTINDLCKYLSSELHIPYVVFPTALSMNGYASANASITVEGHKHTLEAQLPRAILVNLDVCAAAPQGMTAAGSADVLCRATAQADWLLSHLLLGTDYDEKPFRWLKPHEDLLLAGGENTQSALAHAIILSGLGMTHAGGSYPASQGEHMIAHTMEMQYRSKALHGAAVGVAALAMSRLQHRLLESRPSFTVSKNYKSEIKGYFGKAPAPGMIEAYEAKLSQCGNLAATLEEKWPAICKKLEKVMIPTEKLQSALKAAGAPTTPAELGWKEADFNAAMRHAKYMRERFTFLDLAD